jgi:capsular exopolysaccharide synthesis family protein
MLVISPRRESDLIDVKIVDTDAERAALLVNLVTEVYREQNLEARRDSAREAKVWLQEQLSEYTTRIQQLSSELIAYQVEHDLADAEEEVTRLSALTESLNVAHGSVSTERVLLQTTVNAHDRLLAQGAYSSLAKDISTELLMRLIEEHSMAVTENARMAARYGENMPERRYSDANLASIDAELRNAVETTVATERAQLDILRAKEASLKAEIDTAKDQLIGRQTLHEQYEVIKLQLDRSKEFYQTLSRRNDELDLAARTQLNNVRVVDAARPQYTPVSPNIPRNMMFAFLIGLIGGAAIGLLREYFDDTISSPFDVSTYLKVPFLGLVPRFTDLPDDRARALYTLQHPSSAAAEAVRAMRTILELSPNGKSLRRLLITSSVSSEGKTSTAVSLSVSFANLGRKVLVVDADLRRPRMHHLFDVPKDVGLSSVLQGTPLDEAIVPSGVPGLDVLVAGPQTERPNELLASVAMSELLDELDHRYDMIVIDTPPSGMLSDAAILSKLVDGLVVVVREQTVSRTLVKDVVFRLKQVGAPLLGVVVNAVDMTGRASRYKYYYGYRYRYDKYYDEGQPKPNIAAK